jgi:pyruvate, orthophosphate dikinase
MKALLGGKGANLAEMTRIGLPVPPGFTITTEVCTYYYANKRTYPPCSRPDGSRRGQHGKIMGCKFGDAKGMPLLVAVRSGARDSMPGMMDTILNLGLNDETVKALAAATKNERFAWDCYRRFVQMYGDVVLGVQKREGEDHEPFEPSSRNFKHEKYTARTSSTPTSPPTTRRNSSSASRRSSRSAPARASRAIRGTSSAVPPAPCSAPG